MSAISALIRPDRYPRSSRYDPRWGDCARNGTASALWQLEDILPALALEPGSRVLDLGCGRGGTSVFLVRECGVTVTACDLWVSVEELAGVFREAGVEGSVTAVNADVRQLPFADDEFDAIVSVDAFEYFGTDVHLLPALLRVLKSGGTIGMTTPGLEPDPYEADVADAVWSLWAHEVAAWHTPEWWRRHWELSGLLEGIESAWLPDGRENWIRWVQAVQSVSGKAKRQCSTYLKVRPAHRWGLSRLPRASDSGLRLRLDALDSTSVVGLVWASIRECHPAEREALRRPERGRR